MTSLFRLERERDDDELARLLRDSENPAIRARAAEILGELDVPDQTDEGSLVERLVAAARDDADEGVRAAAIDALDQREAFEQLIEALAGDDVPDAGADWAKAEALVESLAAERPELRMAAANVLGRLGDRAATAPLVEALSDSHPLVRARAARALGRVDDRRAVEALTARLADDSVDVRREAADALGRLGGDEALSALLALLSDGSETVRHIAASSLGNFASAKPVDGLAGLLSDESDVVRRAAVFSLIEVLSNAPPARSHQLRETIVERLSATDDPSVVASLVEILDEGVEAHQRRNAAWLLGRVVGEEGRETAVQALARALGDTDDVTAQFASTSLASIGGAGVEDALLDTLDDADASRTARSKAAFALGKVGGDRSRERLDALVDRTDDEEVRKQAFSALSKLGGRR